MTNNKKQKIDIEQLMDELEEIANNLQSGTITLQESIDLYKAGINIAKSLDEELSKAELTIETLKTDLNKLNNTLEEDD
ncbi:MAG: exodeoxyribonuclease VII small subunit [Dehalococcoidia bacterium]|nr:exodeoxyribonuclease VII small subunit [Dehalococcoidia bacterium]